MPLHEALARERIGSTPVETGSEDRMPRAQVPAWVRRRGFSLLRASVGERLGLVAAVLVLLWLSVYWALQ